MSTNRIERLIIHRCDIPECPSRVVLIEMNPLDSPEKILEMESELATKTASHNRKWHS